MYYEVADTYTVPQEFFEDQMKLSYFVYEVAKYQFHHATGLGQSGLLEDWKDWPPRQSIRNANENACANFFSK